MGEVTIREERVMIPTYEIGAADKNPIFLENRVYQGSSGKIYPYPTVEKISDEKTEKEYKAVYIENEYLQVIILPELGGRIQRAYDKTNDYDFVYYNHVIKPALVGLCGPWISGGIEFNWPQHHRPTTYSPVDYVIREEADGSKTCSIHDNDQMYGTQVMTSFTLRPGKAYIEIHAQLYNRTSMPQTFLWWANPAVPVNNHTQSIFPPDVHAVMDHGKRDVSSFPIATGTYYKHDYSAGVDISRYKNIPVPTSYMAEKSDFNFVGGYDYQVEAGLLHVADHHVSPGKKQWTWGSGEFGKAWDRNLTDEDGPYIELMTGVYTDNQPDFTWLKPMEEKTFTQYFMPYKKVGPVKNATIHGCVNLETKDHEIYLCVYTTEKYGNAVIKLTYGEKTLLEERKTLSPTAVYENHIQEQVADETQLKITVTADGKEIVSYQPLKKITPELPKPAEAAKDPEEILTNEELYLTGTHIEQYRHATYRPDPYYLEGLKRDPGDIRINNAYGLLLMRRGRFQEAEQYFRTAIKRATWKNPNPYTSEPYYNLGIVLFYQDRNDEAFDAFYKAAWSNEQQEMSYYYLAAIESRRHHYQEALELCEKGLCKNTRNIKARALKLYLLRKCGKAQEAENWYVENIKVDTFDYLSRMELAYLQQENATAIRRETKELCRDYHETYLNIARDYSEAGAYEEAVDTLSQYTGISPMISYYKAYYLSKVQAASGCDGMDKDTQIKKTLQQGEKACSDYVFPNKLEDMAVLEYAIVQNPEGSKAPYYLGNLLYDKFRYEQAVELWEQSVKLDDTFPIAWRNLSLAYYNKLHQQEKAKTAMERAWALNEKDPRIFLELDQLYKKLKMTVEERLQRYENYKDVFMQRDDLIIEYATLQNLCGHYEKAYQVIMEHKFHPWEGGEGKVTTQYTVALVEMARKAMAGAAWEEAETCLRKALYYPENLGEGKLEGCKDNHINYYLGYVLDKMGRTEESRKYYETATVGTDEPAGMMYYNDQPADMIYYQGAALEALGRSEEAASRYEKLLRYGMTHHDDEMRVEYFAVSLPDFLIFDDDLNQRNRAHCDYLCGLGYMGKMQKDAAAEEFKKALQEDNTHLNALRYLNML
ncbi:MAG: DUF5107 domain-containing protein [Lachnospiraceae bacterium]|nr:DUF5107 domain-containing protein [Lachnospiraceae bacterium]